ncbi:MAG: adenylate kinase [Longimicrobiales bacterium]|nr:adenylate kinase [Longimicrobiales bacterium]
MVVVLLGPPGVGKGTQAVRLVDDLSAAHVSTGDLLRAARREGTELGNLAQGFMDRGELVPDDLILDLVKEHLIGIGASRDVVFDGFPRTTDQATGLDVVLETSGRKVDTVVLFEAPDDVLVQRLSGRRSCPDCGAVHNAYFSPPAVEGVCDRCGGTLQHRADDEPDTVKRRLQVYLDQTAPLIAFYEDHPGTMTRIGADRDVEAIYAEFNSAVTGSSEGVS